MVARLYRWCYFRLREKNIMELFVRKIKRPRWDQTTDDVAKIRADAITLCLRTSSNKLSVWGIHSEKDINQAILAIASSLDHLETFDIVILEKDFFVKNNIDFVKSDGETAATYCKQDHVDITNLTYEKLGVIASYILQQIKKGKCHRHRLLELKDMIEKAIAAGKVEADLLSEFIIKKINKA